VLIVTGNLWIENSRLWWQPAADLFFPFLSTALRDRDEGLRFTKSKCGSQFLPPSEADDLRKSAQGVPAPVAKALAWRNRSSTRPQSGGSLPLPGWLLKIGLGRRDTGRLA